jgi:hypothetical protein
MDLIDRYLAAVGVLLPLRQREDITAELRDALMARTEEREAELGRPITRGEEADLLRAFGHPLAVAARYGRGQYLIGPELYPLYVFALKALLAIAAISAVITGVVQAAVQPGQPGPAIVAALGALWTGAATSIGVLTIIAAIIQHQNIRLKFLDDWNPENLSTTPRRPLFRRQTAFDHVGGVIAQTLFIGWWTRAVAIWIPYITYIPLNGGQRLDLTRAVIWDTLFWPVLGLMIVTLALNVLKLMGKERHPFVRALDLARDLAAMALAFLALQAGHWVQVSGVGLPTQALAKIDYGVNLGMQIALIVALASAAWLAAYHAWRLYDDRRTAA